VKKKMEEGKGKRGREEASGDVGEREKKKERKERKG
jgi:hypothetical protein